jgi:hypothetical protein
MKAVFAFLWLLAPAMAGTARPAIVGSWDCVAKDDRGVRTTWILAVKSDGDKLSATLQSQDSGDLIPLQDVAFDGAALRFRIRINETEVVEVTAKLDADRLEGQFAGKDSGRGSFQATRRVDLTGEWSGQWEISPDGSPGPHYMKLKQEGEKVTGTAGPSPEQQIPISGKYTNGVLTFDVVIPNGPSLQLEFKLEGETLRGDAVLKMNGSERKLKLSATRAGK